MLRSLENLQFIVGLAMMLVYLMTPQDLVIQIGASINRTMLPVIGLTCVGCFYLLESYFEQ